MRFSAPTGAIRHPIGTRPALSIMDYIERTGQCGDWVSLFRKLYGWDDIGQGFGIR